MDKNVYSLTKNSGSQDILGGKACSLIKLNEIGVNVPEGYVIPTSVYYEFVSFNNIELLIDEAISKISLNAPHTIVEASEVATSLILGAEMSDAMKQTIMAPSKSINTNAFAVRSSANCEDGVDSAWAGQFETYLNVAPSDILDAIRKCWASLYSTKALSYRCRRGYLKHKISMAVIVQKTIMADVSGIAFSVHPISKDANQVLIESCSGFGEALVSGSITPDTYLVRKDTKEIIEIHISTQNRQLEAQKKGGLQWVNVEKSEEAQKLTDAEITQVSEMVIFIEKMLGSPQDIEWVKNGNTFYIVQARPITTL